MNGEHGAWVSTPCRSTHLDGAERCVALGVAEAAHEVLDVVVLRMRAHQMQMAAVTNGRNNGHSMCA